MVLTTQAPVAPTDGVVKVLETYRDTGLGGGSINAEVMGRMGFGGEIARRILQSLGLLGLIEDDGTPTDTLKAFREAPTNDYKTLFANVLRDVYAPVFAVIGSDPTGKSTVEIEDAFRTFSPASLRKRMVTLFVGLCRYADIITGAEDSGRPPRKPAPARPREVRRSESQRRMSNNRSKQDETPPPPPATSLDHAREKYVELLLAKAAETDDPDADLLDRIERALGISPAKAPT